MKKAFFIVVVLAVFLPAMVFAQNARWAEVRVSYNLFGGIGVSDNVYVRAVDQRNAEGLAVLKFEEENLFSPVTRAVFVRWLTDAEYTQMQKQEQQRKEKEQREEQQRQAEQKQQAQQREAEWKRDNPPSKFFGTWNSVKEDRWYNPDSSVVISNDKLKYTKTDGKFFNFNISKWDADVSNNRYILSGTVEETNLPDNLSGKTVIIRVSGSTVEALEAGANRTIFKIEVRR